MRQPVADFVARLEAELVLLADVVRDQVPVAPSPSVVELLEAALARARRGEVLAAGVALVLTDGGSSTAWDTGAPGVAALHLAVTRLGMRLVAHEPTRPDEDSP